MISCQFVWVSVMLHVVMGLNFEAIVNEGINLSELCKECDTTTGSGYAHHPRYCHLFVHCSLGGEGRLRGQVKECTRGLLWSRALKQCVWPDQSDCPDNPCRKQRASFRDVRTCNGYFSCPSGTHLDFNCCPPDHRYEQASGLCVLDPSCTHPCLPGSSRVTAQTPDCDRQAVPGNPRQYLWAVDGQNITMTCATGTAYSQRFCSCTQTSNLPVQDQCEPYIHFPFNTDLSDRQGHTASGGSADIAPSLSDSVGPGAAHFNGQQQVVAWAMNNMEFRSNFTLTFRFKADLPRATNQRIALVDNSDCDKEATFGAALLITAHNRGEVHGGFRLKNGRAYTASSEELPLDSWHEVALVKHRDRALLIVDRNLHLMRGQGLERDIERVDCSMTIGTGTSLQGFVGYIDEVKYYKCVPDQYL